MSDVHVAQINIGVMRAPTDDPAVADFMNALDRINALADAAPGFVWRLQTDDGNATDIQIFPNPLRLVNMSVWASVDELRDYVYRSEHVEFFRRRAEWFEADAKQVALWTVPAGNMPELDDAVRRVAFLERHGSSPYAYGFSKPPGPLVFETTDPDDRQTQSLISRLNTELADLADHPDENHFTLHADQVSGANGLMLRARHDGDLVGCGAVRTIDAAGSSGAVGEIKRMYVDTTRRGLKIGAALLDQLELGAARLGLTELRLETGPRQTAAVGLYERAGYEPRAAWGEYADTAATSRCFRKPIEPVG